MRGVLVLYLNYHLAAPEKWATVTIITTVVRKPEKTAGKYAAALPIFPVSLPGWMFIVMVSFSTPVK